MRNNKIRIIFLGDRRISWEVLKILSSPEYSQFFDLRVLVTNSVMYREYVSIASNANVQFIDNGSRQTSAIRAAIIRERIDVLFSVQYNWVLPPEILDSVNRRAFNLHNARLPNYKGYNSISHAILNGDETYESTVHWMDDTVDSGDIAYIGVTKIHCTDTAQSLYIRTVDSAVTAFKELLADLRNKTQIPRRPMSSVGARFYGRTSLDDFVDLTNVTELNELAKISRALYFPPFNMAYLVINELKYYIAPEQVHLNGMVSSRPANEPIYESTFDATL